ncbi:MAG: hypothetical protein P4L64_12735 [Caulobacteraceae bacterium]|nr:hypothetical protein [Caulobacteraceae bacterium]
MAVIFVENCHGNGKIIKITESFGAHTIRRSLKPGENARITVSRYRSVVVEEIESGLTDDADSGATDGRGETWPTFLQRRCG